MEEIVSLNHENIILLSRLTTSLSYVTQDTNKLRKGKMFHYFQTNKLRIPIKSVILSVTISSLYQVESVISVIISSL